MPEQPPFPELIDSTKRSAFISCPRKFYWEWIRSLTNAQKSPDLHAGGAFARAIEVVRKEFYTNGQNLELALVGAFREFCIEWGEYDSGDHIKSFDRMWGAVEAYFNEHPPGTDYLQPFFWEKGGRPEPAVEFTFSFPIANTAHPQTGRPILYGGRFDMIGELHKSALYICDEKTTKALGNHWGQQWDIRGQLLGYVYATRRIAQLPVAGSIIRGISILKGGYGHAEVIIPAQDWMIDQWYEQLQRDVRKMIAHYNEGYWDQAFADACNAYSGCPMKRLCLSNDPESWISNFYVRNAWDPLKKNPEEPQNPNT